MKKAVIVSAVIGLAASFSFRGVVPSNEEELFNLGHITHEVGSFVHKNQGTIEQGAQTVGDIVSGNYVGAVSSGIKTVGDATHQSELFNLGHITHEVGSFVNQNKGAIEASAQTVGDIATGNYVGAVDSGIKTVDDATNQLFNLGHITHEVGSFVNKNKGTIEAGAQTVGDIATGNYVGAVDSGITTVDDATDQNELFNLGHITHEVGSFVNKNKGAIEAGAQTVGDIATGNYVGAVDSGITTVDDATNELFNLGHIANQVGSFVNKNEGAIESGAQTVGDIATGNYVGAVDSGIKTVDDATNQFFSLKKIVKKVGSFVNKNKGTIEAGAQTVGDAVTGNYVGAVENGVKTVNDATHH